jgi:hypothetical protein
MTDDEDSDNTQTIGLPVTDVERGGTYEDTEEDE